MRKQSEQFEQEQQDYVDSLRESNKELLEALGLAQDRFDACDKKLWADEIEQVIQKAERVNK